MSAVGEHNGGILYIPDHPPLWLLQAQEDIVFVPCLEEFGCLMAVELCAQGLGYMVHGQTHACGPLPINADMDLRLFGVVIDRCVHRTGDALQYLMHRQSKNG